MRQCWGETPMKVLLRSGLLGLALLAISVQPCAAWGDAGHQLVAKIAARRLTPAARRAIVMLIRNAPDDDIGLKELLGHSGEPQPSASNVAAAMAKMATWPDCMGRDAQNHCNPKGVTGPWHFIDVGLFEGPGHLMERCGVGSCVTEKIPVLITNLTSGTDLVVMTSTGPLTFHPDRELRFLIHFLGDIHQPLHTITNADAGGNCVTTTGFMHIKPELHAAWDSALVALATTGTQGTPGAILNEFQAEESTVASLTDAAQIANESFGLAKSSAYGKTMPLVPTIDHFVDVSPQQCDTQAPSEIRMAVVDGPGSFGNEATKKLVREQLFKAGIRLAEVLKSVFH
jgi:hypothetical protein